PCARGAAVPLLPAVGRADRAGVTGGPDQPPTRATEADHPSRSAPARSRASAVARSRIPPLALTPAEPPTTARSSATSSIVAPPPEKPLDVLTKCAPAARDSSAAS